MGTDDSWPNDLIQASIYSFDEDTWPFSLPRVLPITICVDAGSQSTRIGQALALEAQALLTEYGYTPSPLWGPFQGSHFTTIFGTGDELEDGNTLKRNQENMANELTRRITESFDWRRTAEVAGQTIKIAVAVGTIVSVLAPGPNAIVIGSFSISAKVLALLKASGSAVTIVEAAKKIFFETREASEANEEGQKIPYPPPPDRIKIMNPLVLKVGSVRSR